jgi:NADPH-dependent 2,4-dienoyl-CoA reductase/sulfur reductase-like enzyme
MARTALVLGAGLGGLVAAETLRKLLPKADRVIAVDRAAEHFFPPSLLWLMVGERTPEDFSRPLSRLAARGVEFRRGSVTRIDPAARKVEIDGQPVAADALVIALGAEYAPEAIPGLAEAGLTFYTLEGAAAVRDALSAFSGGRVVVLTAAPLYKCPAAPYEAALLAEDFLRRRGVARCDGNGVLRRRTAADGGGRAGGRRRRARHDRSARHRLPSGTPGQGRRSGGAPHRIRQRRIHRTTICCSTCRRIARRRSCAKRG